AHAGTLFSHACAVALQLSRSLAVHIDCGEWPTLLNDIVCCYCLMMTRSVTVYCSSSSAVDSIYIDAAIDLGRAIAQNNWTLVYGGNSVGLMAHLADSVRANRGKVIGITPQMFIDKGVHDRLCDEFVVTE